MYGIERDLDITYIQHDPIAEKLCVCGGGHMGILNIHV